MSDLLIFDVLLIRGGIRNPDALFPPVDPAGIKRLLQAILRSTYDALKKDCLVYILLKWAGEGRETSPGSRRFAEERCIPPQFVALADAYWLLDTGSNLAKAISILSDARLNRDYVSKILQALSIPPNTTSQSSPSSPHLTPASATLIVRYVQTAKPPLTEPADISLYALSLAHTSFVSALNYARTFHEGSEMKERVWRELVGWCLMRESLLFSC
ncbi:hypothetical protein HYDPIDRAFT_178037 [Hydnomerulius pinastri MD-312]|uniref:ELYS-like domain-containing protein n=1 Tax=Hydnomerulius pinastri MD-312 TaxID=994086 RepID=A0A0C9W754_9AGAM|nr:hypothetical protein HYDPIDRAFT_178037 [Hydnomerulius pinastri MD-312]